MLKASVTEEQEAVNNRPMFVPILVRGSGPRKGAFLSAQAYHSFVTRCCHDPQAFYQHEPIEQDGTGTDHPTTGRRQ